MGIRETLNENPRITTGVTAGIVVVIFIYILWNSFGGGGAGPGRVAGASQAFFTDDDGKTWFADDATKVPPFQHNGKEAVRAYVYKCGGKTFVNHMERYVGDAKKKMEELQKSKTGMNDPTRVETIQREGLEVKSPGDKAWTKSSDFAKATAIVQPKCPGGGSDLEVVSP